MIARKVIDCTGADIQKIAFKSAIRLFEHMFIIAKNSYGELMSYSGYKEVPNNILKNKFEYAILVQHNDSDFPYVGKVRTEQGLGPYMHFLCEHDAHKLQDSLDSLLLQYPSIDVFKLLRALNPLNVIALIDEERCEVFGPKFENDIKIKIDAPWYISVYPE